MGFGRIRRAVHGVWTRAGLRARLEAFILLALLPLIALVLVMLLQQRQQEIAHARQQTLLFADRGVAQQADIVQQARSALRMLTLVPEVRQAVPGRCGVILREAMPLHPWSAGFAVAGKDGQILCTTAHSNRTSNLANRDYFQRALTAKSFATSDFLISQGSGKPVLAAALPILDGRGAVERVLLTGIDLTWLAKLSAEVAQTAGGVVTLFDARGTVLVRVPDSENLLGRSMAEHPTVRTILESRRGVVEGPGPDGVARIIGFATLAETGWSVAVGVEHEAVVGAVNRKLLWSTGLLAAVVLAIVVGVWFLMEILVLRGLRDLQESAARLSSGELDAGAPGASARAQSTEISNVAHAVRSMGRTLNAIAFQDPLTGLANRRFLDAHVERLGAERTRPDGTALALLCIDLDGFKPVNDRHGHAVGDAVLKEVGARLARCVRDGDIAVRLGGDEFVVLLGVPNGATAGLPFEVAGRIIQSIGEPMTADGIALRVGCSVGIALWPIDDANFGTVLRYADHALYAAKRHGRGQAIRHGDNTLAELTPLALE